MHAIDFGVETQQDLWLEALQTFKMIQGKLNCQIFTGKTVMSCSFCDVLLLYSKALRFVLHAFLAFQSKMVTVYYFCIFIFIQLTELLYCKKRLSYRLYVYFTYLMLCGYFIYLKSLTTEPQFLYLRMCCIAFEATKSCLCIHLCRNSTGYFFSLQY